MEQVEVDALSRELLARSFPRVQMVLLLALAGIGAFLASFALLHGGLASMSARYFLATAIGYLLFLALVRAWIAYQRHRWSPDLVDLPIDLPAGGGGSAPVPPFSGGGGGFGGGGASGRFAASEVPAAPSPASPALFDSVPDVDEAWPIALVVLVALGLIAGLSGMIFVVWASPALFAEVLLDAAVVGAVYRRARNRPRSHWLSGVLRRTWLPATTLCVIVAVAGFALEVAHPDADSLRAVLRATP